MIRCSRCRSPPRVTRALCATVRDACALIERAVTQRGPRKRREVWAGQLKKVFLKVLTAPSRHFTSWPAACLYLPTRRPPRALPAACSFERAE